MGLNAFIGQVMTVAAQQHGLVRVAQFERDQRGRLDHLARRGLLERVCRGVYRVTGAPETWCQLLTAGAWALGPSAVVSHRSAARLHGLEGFDRDVYEFAVPRGSRGKALTITGSRVRTTGSPLKPDTVQVDALAVTNATRTIFDMARSAIPDADLEAAIDSAIQLRLTTLDRLIERAALPRGSGRWGTARLDELLVSSGGHSWLERRFLKLLCRAGLDLPTPQVEHRRHGRHIARVDFLFKEHNLVVEVSGGRGHVSASDRAKDARRRNELQQMGRTVLEFTREQVVHDEQFVIQSLAASLNDPRRAVAARSRGESHAGPR